MELLQNTFFFQLGGGDGGSGSSLNIVKILFAVFLCWSTKISSLRHLLFPRYELWEKLELIMEILAVLFMNMHVFKLLCMHVCMHV